MKLFAYQTSDIMMGMLVGFSLMSGHLLLALAILAIELIWIYVHP